MLQKNWKSCLEYLLNTLIDTPKTVALCLSASAGSLRLLDVLLTLNRSVHVYSYTIENAPTYDFDKARQRAGEFERVKFTPIYLPRSVTTLEHDLRLISSMINVTKEHNLMKIWPMHYLMCAVQENVVITGLQQDDPTTHAIEQIAEQYKHTIRSPYLHSQYTKPAYNTADPQITMLFEEMLRKNKGYAIFEELYGVKEQGNT